MFQPHHMAFTNDVHFRYTRANRLDEHYGCAAFAQHWVGHDHSRIVQHHRTLRGSAGATYELRRIRVSVRVALDQTLAVAFAQMRGAVRLMRTWVMGILAVAVTLCVCVFYAYTHGILDPGMFAGGFAPPLMIGELGPDLLWVPLAGILFLAFDFREADARDRIAEAIDAKPASNLTVIVGRLAGTVVVVAVPVFLAVTVLHLAGWTARAADYWMGDPFEPYSLVGFLVVDAIPAMVLWCATVMLLSAVLRNRVAVLVAAVSLLALQAWLMSEVSVYVLPALPMASHAAREASDLAPWLADSDTLLQRLAMLLMAAGFCLITAAARPQRDNRPRAARLVAGLSLVAVSVLGIGLVALGGLHGVQERESWLAAHRGARHIGTIPDVEELSGTVRIVPGELLEVNVEAFFGVPDATSVILFTLNPGLRVTLVNLDGRPVEFSHTAGLLSVHPVESMASGARGRLELAAAGVPDPEFGYLGTAVDWRYRSAKNRIRRLGTQAAVFQRNYVALTPTVHWLPRAGTVLDIHPDFFRLDLRVEAPVDWWVAGPGRQARADTSATRFSPRQPVREAALYASRFARRGIKLQSIEVELLASPDHLSNLEYFEPAVDAAVVHLEGLLETLERGGLPYLDRVLTLVEVPATLRTYRGGWLMDPTRSPGVLTLREQWLPMARFGRAERLVVPPGAHSDDVRDWRLHQLLLTLANGGPDSAGILRSFAGTVLDGTAPAGEGSTALDYVCRELAFRSLFPWAANPYAYSAHAYDTDAPLGSSVGEFWNAVSAGHYGHLLPASQGDSSGSPLWVDAASVPLSEIDALPPRRAANALVLKGGSLAEAITDSLGGESTLEILGMLRGLDQPFTAESFIAIVKNVHADIGRAVEQTWRDAGLPGFVPSQVKVVSFSDPTNGQGESYLVSVHVRNDEPVSGAVRLGFNEYNAATDPVWVRGDSSVEIGLVTTDPPEQLWLLPYLSLNRETVRLALPRAIQGAPPGFQPFTGTRPSTWRPPQYDVVVDDLGPGFSTASKDRGWSMPAFFRTPSSKMDEGLPYTERETGEWIRRSVPGSWGKYRRTVAQSLGGDGDHRAVFEANLAAGRWQLDYHLPPRLVPSASPGGSNRAVFPVLGPMAIELVVFEPLAGTLDLAVSQTSRQPVEFDAAAGVAGWNTLGEFELAGGTVRLEVTNRTDGRAVVADAIRWRRIE